ncbi:MAG: transposase [Candidatus Peribacteria bacterium]|nr:transposase [Candidatus Peribacteria bacterium]
MIGYIGRYVKRPVIAQSRILDYDGDTITFCYIDKTEKDFFKRTKNITCPDMEFIAVSNFLFVFYRLFLIFPLTLNIYRYNQQYKYKI